MIPGSLADKSLFGGWALILYVVATSKLEVNKFAGILLHSH